MSDNGQQWAQWSDDVLARVSPSRTLVAVVDVQNDFCDPGGALARLGGDVGPCRDAAERIRTFLSRVRPFGSEIAFFRLVYSPDAMNLAQRERLLRDGTPVVCNPLGSGTDLFLVEPTAADQVFVKHQYSAFSCEPFRRFLSARRIENILVTGVDTHICVEGTVRDGFDLGYRMLVLEDLVATRASAASSHQSSLAVIRRYFGLVLTSADLLQRWESSREAQTLPTPPTGDEHDRK